MTWYLIIAIAVAYLLIGAVVSALLEEAMEHETDASTIVLVIFWPIVIAVILLILVFEGLEFMAFLVRSGIKKMLKKKTII